MKTYIGNRYGGKVGTRFSKETTHLLTAHASETDEVRFPFPTKSSFRNSPFAIAQSVLIAKEINPNIAVVTPNWLNECARRSSPL